MAHKYDHLREKAIQLRTQQEMSLDEIIERLQLPKTTIYSWIKDLPIPKRENPFITSARGLGTKAMQQKFAALRDDAYQQGLAEAPELLKDLTLRDFIVLYMAEGAKRDRNRVSFVNSDAALVKLAYRWMQKYTTKKFYYALQYHVDHDENELKQYWAALLGIDSQQIRSQRKSNSGKLSGRQFRSVYGLLTVETNDTYFRARLQGCISMFWGQARTMQASSLHPLPSVGTTPALSV